MQVSTAATLQKGNYVIFQNVYIFLNLDKVILLMIKKIEMSRGNMVSTVNPMSGVCMLSLCVCEWVGSLQVGQLPPTLQKHRHEASWNF